MFVCSCSECYNGSTMTIRNQWLKKPNVKNEVIIEMYQKGLSSEQIGKELGLAKSSVSRRLKKLGIKLRTSSDYEGKDRYWLWKGEFYRDPVSRKRSQRKHRNWSLAVRQRDGFKCTKCGASNCKLEAHHNPPIEECMKLGTEFSISNGVTLCIPCHRNIHKKQNVLGK